MPHGFPTLGEEEKPTDKEDVVYTDDREDPPDLRFLHYNDIYHPDAQSEEPAGGAGRFKTLTDYYRDDKAFKGQVKLITVFSGDAYNPSTESAVTRGSHMVPFLNEFGTDIACVGNHDFDFGAAQFEKLAPRCNFPWLLTNVFDPSEGENVPLGHCHRTYMWEASNGIKIGFMGLAEREWAEKGNSLPANLEYYEMLETAKKVGPELREQGADMVIALTHCRQPRDFAFGEALPAGCVDMILAGHDHWWEHKIWDNGTHLVRSGSDFKMLSYIKAWKKKDGDNKSNAKWDWSITRRYVMRSIEENKEMMELARKTMDHVRNRMEKPIGYTIAPLDARDSTVKSKESNYANFVTDILRLYYKTDVALMTGKTVKGDQVLVPGMIRLKFITESFPFEDAVVVVRITGQDILDALENGLKKYEERDGLFLHVSGMTYTFDPKAEPGKRVQEAKIGEEGEEEQLDKKKKYTVACRSRLAFGADGFDTLCMETAGGKAEEVVPDEYGILISMLLRQYFMSLQVLGGMSKASWGGGMATTWGGIDAQMNRMHPVRDNTEKDPREHGPAFKGNVDTYDSDDEDAPEPGTQESVEHGRRLAIMRKTLRKWRKVAGCEGHSDLMTYQEEEHGADWTKGICPMLHGRIKIVGGERGLA